MCSLNYFANEDSVDHSVTCPCTAAWRGTPERGRAPRTSCGTWTWRHTCSCWRTRCWRVWPYTRLTRLTELGRWIMLAESPSASRRKKWRKNSFLFCRIFRSDYPINVWKLVTEADYRDNQGKWNWYLRAYSWTEHEENLICFVFNYIHSLTFLKYKGQMMSHYYIVTALQNKLIGLRDAPLP